MLERETCLSHLHMAGQLRTFRLTFLTDRNRVYCRIRAPTSYITESVMFYAKTTILFSLIALSVYRNSPRPLLLAALSRHERKISRSNMESSTEETYQECRGQVFLTGWPREGK